MSEYSIICICIC